MNSQNNINQKLWVFGYGSLCWNPGFQFKNKLLGSVRGYVRRFWQGNNTHRGTTEKPGRVATLVEDDQGITWGIAYELVGEAALEYLEQRECTLGGYQTIFTSFYPRHGIMEPFPVLLYVATPDNSQWLGPAPLPQLAIQISQSRGTAGHNFEYVIRLADFMRENLPEIIDDHLFSLEDLVKQQLQQHRLPIDQTTDPSTTPRNPELSSNIVQQPNNIDNNTPSGSSQYQVRLDPKTLRCVKL